MGGAVVAALVLIVLLPDGERIGPPWLLPLLAGLLLVALIAGDPGTIDRRSNMLRVISIALVLVLVANSLWATAQLIDALIKGGEETESAGDVLAAGTTVWISNCLAFALLYWELDSGGAAARAHRVPDHPDFAFRAADEPGPGTRRMAPTVRGLPIPGLHERDSLQSDGRHATGALGQDRDDRTVADLAGAPGSRDRASRQPVLVSGRPQLLNLASAIAFTIGGSLFALGAALAELGSADLTAPACIYFAGGLFFNTGGYVSVLQVINPPGRDGWRWWAWEPERVAWVSAALLFAGTLVFGVNLADSFIQGLTAKQQNRLIWAPDMVGCTLFLVSGHLALRRSAAAGVAEMGGEDHRRQRDVGGGGDRPRVLGHREELAQADDSEHRQRDREGELPQHRDRDREDDPGDREEDAAQGLAPAPAGLGRPDPGCLGAGAAEADGGTPELSSASPSSSSPPKIAGSSGSFGSDGPLRARAGSALPPRCRRGRSPRRGACRGDAAAACAGAAVASPLLRLRFPSGPRSEAALARLELREGLLERLAC